MLNDIWARTVESGSGSVWVLIKLRDLLWLIKFGGISQNVLCNFLDVHYLYVFVNINYLRLAKYIIFRNHFQTHLYFSSEFRTKTKLHLVKIFFSSPTFDLLNYDMKANFMTKISTIGMKFNTVLLIILMLSLGGTMGLLTGFSIISGIEIIYFAVKILFSLCKCGRNK